jgi:hypothetical protein
VEAPRWLRIVINRSLTSTSGLRSRWPRSRCLHRARRTGWFRAMEKYDLVTHDQRSRHIYITQRSVWTHDDRPAKRGCAQYDVHSPDVIEVHARSAAVDVVASRATPPSWRLETPVYTSKINFFSTTRGGRFHAPMTPDSDVRQLQASRWLTASV